MAAETNLKARLLNVDTLLVVIFLVLYEQIIMILATPEISLLSSRVVYSTPIPQELNGIVNFKSSSAAEMSRVSQGIFCEESSLSLSLFTNLSKVDHYFDFLPDELPF